MSIQSPVGTLDIKNATLRVGKLEVSNIQGIDTALNVTRANSVLIYDDQVSTTTFNGFTSSGVRDTGNGYLDLAGGYVYWGQKLPNSWVMDFEMDIRSGTNAGPLYANVFSTTNTGGDGYSFTFNDSNDKISLYYDSTLLTETTVSGLFTASEDWQKVVINYERGLIAISLDGSRKFYYKDIERETPYVNGEYVSFSSASTDERKIRDLRIVNGEKWVYSGESNVVYTQGSVGIGVTDPTVALDVSGTVKATVFDGDGSAITNISSANVGDFASNVVRIENLETSNGHIWSSLASNVTILRGEIDSNLATARTDLQSNVTILRDEIDSNLATARTDLQSNVTILRGEIDSNLATARMDLQSNVTILRDEIDSNLATARTDLQSNVTILRDEIDSNLATARTDLQSNVTILRGEIDSNLATARTDLQSNVTILRGEIDSNLATARTDLQSNVTILRDTAITFMGTKTFQDDVVLESNLRVQGDLLVANTVNMTVFDPILELGSNNLNTGDVGLVMTRHGASNSNVAIFFDESEDTLKLGYTLNGAEDSTLEFDSNALAVSVQGALTATSVSGSGSGLTSLNAGNITSGTINKDRLPTTLNNTTIASTGSGTLTISDSSGDNQSITKYTTAAYTWSTGIHGQNGSGGQYKIANGGDLSTNTRVTIDTAGQVGIATDNPAYTLDVHGTSNVGVLTATSVSGSGSGLTSLNAANISSGTINKDRLPGTLNNTTIGSLAIGANDVTLTAKANYHGLKILKTIDSPDEPATLLLSGDGDVFDDIAFEIRGNTSGSSVDTTTTRNSDDTTFGILHTGHTYIGYANLNPGEAGGNSQSGDPMLNVNGAGAFTGDFEVGTANLFVDVSTSNVGIGTTSPAYTLDVHGTSNVGALTATSVSGNGSGLTSLNASNLASGTVPSARLSLAASDIPDLSASKITSGTLTRPIDTTFITLNVGTRGDVYFEDNSNDNANGAGFTLRTSSNPTTGSIFAVRSSGQAGRLWVGQDLTSTGVNPFYAGYSGTNGGESNSSSYNFVVTTSGDVGIGTTSPGYTLDVHGTSNVGALTTTSVSGNGSGLTSLNASNLASGTVSSDRLSLAASDIPDLSASKITSGTLGRPISTSTGVFTSTGNVVLVGPNGGGQVGLTINDGDGNANITFNHASRVPDQNGSSGRIDCGVDGTTGYMRLRVKSSVTGGTSTGNLPECVRIEEGYVRAYSNFYVDDNVGIGTTSPIYKLDVRGDVYVDNSSVFMSGYSEGPTNNTVYSQYIGKRYSTRILAGMEIENVRTNSAGTAITTTGHYGQKLHFRAHDYGIYGGNVGDRTMTIVGSNVGIGTTSPKSKLDVYGAPFIQHDTRRNLGAAAW